MAVTLAAAIERVAATFAGAGLVFGHGYGSAWDEAVALVLHVTGLPDDSSVLQQPVNQSQVERIDELAARRCGERVPLAYLLGRCHFAGLEFLVEPEVLVPRSPIGALLAAGLEPWLRREPRRVLDLCCGSGCLGIVAAVAFPGALIDLSDVAERPLALARRNLALHGLVGRVRVHRSDLFEDLPGGAWDLIVCNPPYVDALDMATLPQEYRHEPAVGLAGGRDGLDLVARLLDGVADRLTPGGLLVCEVGASAAALIRRYPRTPFVWPDLPGGGEGVFLLEAPNN